MAITSVSSISSLIGKRPSRRKFQLRKGGSIMAKHMRGKKKAKGKSMTRGKRKKK
jgi:hypothetical protein